MAAFHFRPGDIPPGARPVVARALADYLDAPVALGDAEAAPGAPEVAPPEDVPDERGSRRMRWGLAIGIPVAAVIVALIGHARTQAQVPPTAPPQMAAASQAQGDAAPVAAVATADWQAVAAGAARDVGLASAYHCGGGACASNFTGTAYLLDAPWPASSGINGTSPVVVTARHVACDPGNRIDRLTAFGITISDTHTPAAASSGLCLYDGLGGAPAADLASFSYTGALAPLQVAKTAPVAGDVVLVLGHPLGESPTAPVVAHGTVIATDVTLQESAVDGLAARAVHGAVEIRVQSFPGDSGAPVLDAQGRVIGTIIAGGAVTRQDGTADQVAYAVSWRGAPTGYVQQDGLVNVAPMCPGGLAGLLCRV